MLKRFLEKDKFKSGNGLHDTQRFCTNSSLLNKHVINEVALEFVFIFLHD